MLITALFLLAAATADPPKTSLLSEDPRFRDIQRDWGFADAVISGDMVYLSGVVVAKGPSDPDLESAYRRSFAAIGRILARAGVGWVDVVDITSFHTDVKGQLPAMVAAKRDVIAEPFPAWTAIQVSRLIPDAGITEIKVIARRPAPTH